MAQPPSSEGAKECSPRRKPWVRAQKESPAPEGRKKTQADNMSAAPLKIKISRNQLQQSPPFAKIAKDGPPAQAHQGNVDITYPP
jgi:hypothetical protein